MQSQALHVIKNINCIYLPATNTEESAQWYMEHLGLELLRPVDANQAQLGIGSGQAIFLIRSQEPHNLNYTEIGGSEQCALTLEVQDLPSLYEKMKNAGAHVSDLEDNGSCGHNFFAYDPAGNKIDLWSGWPANN
ncbi:VOC family protein [Paenibacillus soyae]|uniref:VOC family protein n=1 Tax=Paenibacillus soyae TaxID=2969249 RepID=A0A9X2MW42_9BACL|nr:VOC family protein [Paenibacillus soyae]